MSMIFKICILACMALVQAEGEDNEFPSKGTLVYNRTDLCADVLIISIRMAVTTADVLEGKQAEDYSLLAGGYDISDMDNASKSEVLYSVSSFVIHDDYQPGKNMNNFGLIILVSDLEFGPKIQKACFTSNVKRGDILEEPKSSTVLYANKVMVKRPFICRLKFPGDFSKKQHFCVIGPKTKCQAHSTPLYLKSNDTTQFGVGVISHQKKCGFFNREVAMNVKYFVDTMVKTNYPDAELCTETN